MAGLPQRQLGAPVREPRRFTGLVIGVALTHTFGRMVGDQRHGWALFAVMAILFVAGLAVIYDSEAQSNGALASLHLDQSAGNMEGKEVGLGVGQSPLWATVATASSDGAVGTLAAPAGTLPTHGMQFVGLMVGTIVVVNGLTFFPALALGPTAGHSTLQAGQTYRGYLSFARSAPTIASLVHSSQ